jgi:hypothetical protein
MLDWKKWFLAAVVALLAGSALAHPGHDSVEFVTEPEAVQRAEAILAAAMANKKLHISWMDKQLKSAATRDTPNGAVWMVVFNNPAEPDVTKRTVYIFLDPVGNYLGANFTGPPK